MFDSTPLPYTDSTFSPDLQRIANELRSSDARLERAFRPFRDPSFTPPPVAPGDFQAVVEALDALPCAVTARPLYGLFG